MESKKRNFRVSSPEDMLLALAQADTDAARAVLEDARTTENYYREKIALKLVAFHEAKEEMVNLYTEARLNYPQLAVLMEENNPFLEELYDEAVKRLERNQRMKNGDGE